MFFSGDPTTRKRVDLGGRSSKERDRQKLLEQTRLERNRRLYLRKQNHAAIKIQVGFIEFEFEFNSHCYIAALHVYVMLFAFAQGAMIVLVYVDYLFYSLFYVGVVFWIYFMMKCDVNKVNLC